MPKKKKNNPLPAFSSDNPSRFVIDLKPAALKPFLGKKAGLFSLIKRIKEKKIKAPELNFNFSVFGGAAKEKLKQLAFFSLLIFAYRIIKAVFTALFRLSYGTGWLMAFTVKLIINFSLALLKPAIFASGWFIKTFIRGLESNGKKIYSSGLNAAKNIFLKPFRQGIAGIFNGNKEKINWNFFIPRPNSKSARAAFSFFILAAVLVIPVKVFSYYKELNLSAAKGKVLGASMDALGNIISAGSALGDFRFSEAGKNFSQASEDFLAAENEVKKINNALFLLAGLSPDENLRLASEGKNILAAGKLAGELGQSLSSAMDALFSLGGDDLKGEKNLIDVLNAFTPKISQAKDSSHELNGELKKINKNNIPDEQKENFIRIVQAGEKTEKTLNDVLSLSATLYDALGGKEKKRYLLVFQNNAEMRGSGGFIGSFAILDLDKGKIKSLEVPEGGGYDTKGALTKLVRSPKPLTILGPRWFFWDANWWPDWPASAKKLMWFYENSDGSTVDGCIGLTPTVMEKLLNAIGPVDMTGDYGITVSAENFWTETQSITESDEGRAAGKPKKIIGDLMKKIMDELPLRFSRDNLAALVKAVESGLNEKQALVYSTEPKLQKEIERYGWDGKMGETAGDYLMVVNTNIGGEKTDRVISQTIRHKAEVNSDGAIIDTLRISRTHNGVKGEAFTGARNVDWIRVYTPSGSELLEAYGFDPVDPSLYKESYNELADDPDVAAGERTETTHEPSRTKIYNEAGKTVFANWSQLDPGETVEVVLKYRLPLKFSSKIKRGNIAELAGDFFNPEKTEVYPYSLMAEKQPGSLNVRLESSLVLANGFGIIWRYPENSAIMNNGWTIRENLDTDKYWGAIIESVK
ncbi:MAG: DUF4012 domain-containing protein [Patescibacteria group bacterium]|jgi:hypothetical protein